MFKTCIEIEKYLREKCPGTLLSVHKTNDYVVITYASNSIFKKIHMDANVIYVLKQEVVDKAAEILNDPIDWRVPNKIILDWNYKNEKVDIFYNRRPKRTYPAFNLPL